MVHGWIDGPVLAIHGFVQGVAKMDPRLQNLSVGLRRPSIDGPSMVLVSGCCLLTAFGTSSRILRVVLGDSYPEVLTLNTYFYIF